MASRGTEPMLRRELEHLGFEGLTQVPGGVMFRGAIGDGMRATLWSRIAMRVLMEIGRGTVRTQTDLYDFVRSCPLDAYFNADATLAVFASASNTEFRDSRFVGLKTKDAIVDAMRDRYGRRPNVAPRDPDIPVVIHIHGTDARIYLDLAGKPLNMRGYRSKDVDAPLKENIAAALLQYAGWDGRAPLHDPTCGGGTIVSEAAQIALDAAPALDRELAFVRWPLYGRYLAESWGVLVDEARQRRKSSIRGVIIGSDNDRDAIAATRTNLALAGVLDDVTIRKADARKVDAIRGGGFFVFNPPYGERIGGDDEEVQRLYAALAERMLAFDNHTVALISTREALREGFGGAEPTRETDVLNGKLDCRMLVFEQ